MLPHPGLRQEGELLICLAIQARESTEHCESAHWMHCGSSCSSGPCQVLTGSGAKRSPQSNSELSAAEELRHQTPFSSLNIARFSSSGARFAETLTLNPSRNLQSKSTSPPTPTEIGERRARFVRSRLRSGRSSSSVPPLLTPTSLSRCPFGLTDLVSPSSVSLQVTDLHHELSMST